MVPDRPPERAPASHVTEAPERFLASSPGRVLMLVGGYGSGKTEVAVNLAIRLARTDVGVQIADLDLVNPYFRCREARAAMEAHGIRVVAPVGAQAFADLPILLPQIAGLLRPPEGTVSIFDVGGEDDGVRVLASLRPQIEDGRYELWQVINGRRPFTASVEGCAEMRATIEQASRLRVTGLVVNTHLTDETTPQVVLEGWHLGREVSAQAGIPVRCVALMEELADAPELAAIDAPLLRMRRIMLPPWLTPQAEPAATHRTVPIGRPPGGSHG